MLKLCLGSGTEFIDGFIHVDRRNVRRPTEGTMFLRADVRNLSRYFRPGTVETIFAHGLLDSFSIEEGKSLLVSWVSLLKPGGLLDLSVIAGFSQRWLKETLTELGVSELNFTIDSPTGIGVRGCKL